jgi:hypothetical protein
MTIAGLLNTKRAMPATVAVSAMLCCHDAQVLLLIRQIEATATTGSAARISVLCIGQQAIMDAYLCLLHLTTGALLRPYLLLDYVMAYNL